MNNVTQTLSSAFRQRQLQLLHKLDSQPALLVAGQPRARNYRANCYPFRAESHFLWLTGLQLPNAVLLFHNRQSILLYEPTSTHDIIWHGQTESADELQARTLVDQVLPLAQLGSLIAPIRNTIATIPSNDPYTAAWQIETLGRRILAQSADALSEIDSILADALIALRLCHDEAAIAQMRDAAAITEQAHRAGFRAMRVGASEANVRAAIESEFLAADMSAAYNPIVTRRAEVLHNHTYKGVLAEKDLILIDAGAETAEGWACDVTRTWPVSGTFSPTQRAIYDVVLEAQRTAIAKVAPNVRYREIHLCATRVMLDGLVQLQIFQGDVDGLLERGAGALFFPHGVGHLLGLDVHDMEDLGDRAGYSPGRMRSSRFGECYLRCDRDLAPGMVVTIEPGFYQIKVLLEDREFCASFEHDFNRNELARFNDVRGIRLEDDILVSENGNEILTCKIPIEPAHIESWWSEIHPI